MKKEQAKKRRELPPVDVHDQEAMIALGIHPRHKVPRDESVWTKTPEEKANVKYARHVFGRGIGHDRYRM